MKKAIFSVVLGFVLLSCDYFGWEFTGPWTACTSSHRFLTVYMDLKEKTFKVVDWCTIADYEFIYSGPITVEGNTLTWNVNSITLYDPDFQDAAVTFTPEDPEWLDVYDGRVVGPIDYWVVTEYEMEYAAALPPFTYQLEDNNGLTLSYGDKHLYFW